jgi:hypothetical protein
MFSICVSCVNFFSLGVLYHKKKGNATEIQTKTAPRGAVLNSTERYETIPTLAVVLVGQNHRPRQTVVEKVDVLGQRGKQSGQLVGRKLQAGMAGILIILGDPNLLLAVYVPENVQRFLLSEERQTGLFRLLFRRTQTIPQIPRGKGPIGKSTLLFNGIDIVGTRFVHEGFLVKPFQNGKSFPLEDLHRATLLVLHIYASGILYHRNYKNATE